MKTYPKPIHSWQGLECDTVWVAHLKPDSRFRNGWTTSHVFAGCEDAFRCTVCQMQELDLSRELIRHVRHLSSAGMKDLNVNVNLDPLGHRYTTHHNEDFVPGTKG